MAFNLPVPDGAQLIALTNTGLLYRGATIPFHQIKGFKANNNTELAITFRDGVTVKDEDEEDVDTLVLDIEPNCSHQFFDLQAMIETSLMQLGGAVMDKETREKVVGIRYKSFTEGSDVAEWIETPHITFDFKKVRKGITKAFAYGA